MQEFLILEILHHENEISYDKNIGSLFLCDNNSYNTELSVDPCQCNRPTKRQVISQIPNVYNAVIWYMKVIT